MLLAEAKERRGEMQELSKKMVAKERIKKELMSELESRKSEIAEAKETAKNLKAKVEELEKALSDSQEKCRDLQEQQEKALKEKEELESNIRSEAEKNLSQEQFTKETINNLQDQLESTSKELNELRNKCERLDYLEEANSKLKESLAKLADEYSRDLPEIFQSFNTLTKTLTEESSCSVSKVAVKEFGSVDNLAQESKENLPSIARNSMKILTTLVKARADSRLDSGRDSKAKQGSSIKKPSAQHGRAAEGRGSAKRAGHSTQDENRSRAKHGDHSRTSGENIKSHPKAEGPEEEKEGTEKSQDERKSQDEKSKEGKREGREGRTSDTRAGKSPFRRDNGSEVNIRKPRNFSLIAKALMKRSRICSIFPKTTPSCKSTTTIRANPAITSILTYNMEARACSLTVQRRVRPDARREDPRLRPKFRVVVDDAEREGPARVRCLQL
eukprot:TRINITY_DN4513_c0_g1_i15.p1 TRINITY_DN4513_c0_g1~~TRINITY_DN4513_c0_g1_i15.p1  ORF type:complete len:444 (+),score=140.57 TRINITY_DN4513_c0_g1_i15:447-1778(+)